MVGVETKLELLEALTATVCNFRFWLCWAVGLGRCVGSFRLSLPLRHLRVSFAVYLILILISKRLAQRNYHWLDTRLGRDHNAGIENNVTVARSKNEHQVHVRCDVCPAVSRPPSTYLHATH